MFRSSCSPAGADGPRRSLKTKSVTTLAQFPDLLRMLRNRGLLVLALCLGAVVVRAQDATWSLNPTAPTSVTGTRPPIGRRPQCRRTPPRSVPRIGTSITFPVSPTTVGTLQFNPGAPTYTFSLLDNSVTLQWPGYCQQFLAQPDIQCSRLAQLRISPR